MTSRKRYAAVVAPLLPLLVLPLTLLLLGATAVRAPTTVTEDALDDVFGSLALETPELSEMPFKGSGQKIRFAVMPAPSGLTVEGTNLGSVVSVPVRLTVTAWTVRRGATPLVNNTDYKVVADDPANAARTFVFKTSAMHYTDDTALPSDLVTVEATITLSAGDPAPTTITRTLSRENISIPRLGIPKILALFRHPEFATTKNDVDGFLLILLPSNTPLSTLPGIKNYLGKLQDAVSNLSWAAGFAGAAASVGVMKQTITGHPHTQVRIGGRSNLYDIKMINHRLGRDTHASDAISSLMFLAAKGYQSYFFNNEHYRTNEGSFVLKAGDGAGMVVKVPTLHRKNPPTSPADLLTVDEPSDNDETFGNKISGIRFSAP